MFALWRSTVGKKIVMAVTGVILIAFLVGHLAGNLLVFRGDPDEPGMTSEECGRT